MRALLIIFLLGMLAAAGYFAYSAMAIEGEPIPTEGYVALALGAGFAVLVGIGLMVLLSSAAVAATTNRRISSSAARGPATSRSARR